jgi:Flp pilus assembly protein TadD
MNTTFDTLLERAVAASKDARWGDASALLTEAGTLRPEAPEPRYLRAANLAAIGDFQGAEAEFSACLTLAPHLAIARFQLGLLYMTNGQPDTARTTWEPLLGMQHPLSAFARGLLAILNGDRANAECWIKQGIQANHKNEPLNADMAALLEKLARLDTGKLAAEPNGEPRGTAGPEQEDQAIESDSSMHLLIASYTQR